MFLVVYLLLSSFFFCGIFGNGSPIVTFQCADATTLATRYTPLATTDGGEFWFSAGESFTMPLFFQDFNPGADPVSCTGNNSLYILAQAGATYGGVLRAFDLSNHGKQYLNVSLDPKLFSFSWILYHPSGVLLAMMGFTYGIIELPSDVSMFFLGMGSTQQTLSPDGVVWFQVTNGQSGNYSQQCGWFGQSAVPHCMMGLESLTGLIHDVVLLDQVANLWQSTTVLPSTQDISTIFYYTTDSGATPYSGSEDVSGNADQVAFFDAPVGYAPPGDFDVASGSLGQFYYVSNAYFIEKTKVFYQIDVESGKVVQSTDIDVSFDLFGCGNPNSFTTGPVSFAPNYFG